MSTLKKKHLAGAAAVGTAAAAAATLYNRRRAERVQQQTKGKEFLATNTATPIKVVASIFKKQGEVGDFEWEIEQNVERSTLYIFNDNRNHHSTGNPGSGNAVIRKFNKYGSPHNVRAAGISTGALSSAEGIPSEDVGGYRQLSERVQSLIDSDVAEIRTLLKSGNYTKVKYSADPKSGKLGTRIFAENIGSDVVDYVTTQIRQLGNYTEEYYPPKIVLQSTDADKYPDVVLNRVEPIKNGYAYEIRTVSGFGTFFLFYNERNHQLCFNTDSQNCEALSLNKTMLEKNWWTSRAFCPHHRGAEFMCSFVDLC